MALGTIQTGTGLASGMDIQGTVDKLMALNAKPRDMLKTATDAITTEKTTLTTLSALLYSIEVPSKSLGKTTLYQERTVTSSNSNALAATSSGNPAVGSYEFTPLRLAQSQKLLSSGFASDSTPLGKGTVTIRFGDRVDRSAALNITNGGKGISRGSIRITDGKGNSADIDLSTAQSIDDVLDAINSNPSANITASAVDGHIHLVDNSGGASAMKVSDVGKAQTAESLGLSAVNSVGTADGSDILSLYNNIALNSLNDGMGVEVNPKLGDIKYTLRDGTSGEIDFAVPSVAGTTGNTETSLQQLINEVNSQSNGKLKLAIAPDGNSLALTDTTTGTNKFTLQSEYGSPALHSLGLDVNAVDGVVTAAGDTVSGQRILGGLKTVSLGSLNGGKGIGSLGAIKLTDRSGATDTIDLSSAQTLDDVISMINASRTLHVRAQVNDAGNGIQLIDTSGNSTGSLSVENVDATNTATKLNLNTATGSSNISSVNSGDMHLKVIGMNTLLSSLNGGAGVASGKFTIIDSKGGTGTIDLTGDSIKTIGDVIRAINWQGLTVDAELNATGDGIMLTDSGGKGTLVVAEKGSTTAHDLGLLRSSVTDSTSGQQTINGSMTYEIDILDKDQLVNVNSQINGLNGGFTSSIINDGSAQPYHLQIVSGHTGKAGGMVIDTSKANFSFSETSKAQDSLLLLGPASAATTAVLTSSSTNTYSNLVGGMKLTVKQATGETVNVDVTQASTSLSASMKVFVDDYNKYVDELTKDTAYDATNDKPSALTADSTTFNFQTQMANLVSGQFLGAGKISSLANVGITFTTDGTGHLQYDDTALQNAVESDPQAVSDFFTTKNTGFADRVNNLIEQLAGADKSLLSNRLDALQAKIDDNNKRITEMNTALDAQRQTLLMQFYNMDLAVSKSQTSLNALSSIQWMANDLNGTSSSSKSSSSSSSG